MNCVVITTIQKNTEALNAFRNLNDINLILIGDKKTPFCKDILSIEDQERQGFKIALSTPYNHYCRKNIGYIKAIKNGADFIYDTDDDNIPSEHFFIPTNFKSDNLIKYITNKKFLNVYQFYSTTWRKECFPLMYLPSTVSFRFTDILRGYVAQQIMWHHNFHLGFHDPIQIQKRNFHDLLKDFKDEIFMFINMENIVKILENTKFTDSMENNLYIAYNNLIKSKIIDHKEIYNVENWLNDISI